MERRTLIRLLGAAGTASAAGCVSFGGDETEESPTETPMTTDTDTQRDDAPEDGLEALVGPDGHEAIFRCVVALGVGIRGHRCLRW